MFYHLESYDTEHGLRLPDAILDFRLNFELHLFYIVQILHQSLRFEKRGPNGANEFIIINISEVIEENHKLTRFMDDQDKL